jgi:hypothetical protein
VAREGFEGSGMPIIGTDRVTSNCAILVDFRLRLLNSSPRHRSSLPRKSRLERRGRTKCNPTFDLRRDRMGIEDKTAVDRGHARGAVIYYGHGGWVAQVAELSVDGSRAAWLS